MPSICQRDLQGALCASYVVHGGTFHDKDLRGARVGDGVMHRCHHCGVCMVDRMCTWLQLNGGHAGCDDGYIVIF